MESARRCSTAAASWRPMARASVARAPESMACMDAIPTSYCCILWSAKVGVSYMGLSSRPDSYLASWMSPSIAPRQVMPSGPSVRFVTNHVFHWRRSSKSSSTSQSSPYFLCISSSTLPPTGGCECLALFTDAAVLGTKPSAVRLRTIWIRHE